MNEDFTKTLLEYWEHFDKLGYFDPEEHPEITEKMLKKCLAEDKTVYELGFLPGPDPAFITKVDENGETEVVGWM